MFIFASVLFCASRQSSTGEHVLTLGILFIVVCAILYKVVPEWIDAYKDNRERNRWAEIVQDIPALPPPQIPVFSDSPYTIRGMKYNAWLNEFRSWSHSWSCGNSGARMLKGKQYAAEDRRWHTFFSEWEKIFLNPVLEQINMTRKKESDNRRIQLRDEYKRRFGSNPREKDIPEWFCPVSGASIASCYVKGEWRNRRNNHV